MNKQVLYEKFLRGLLLLGLGISLLMVFPKKVISLTIKQKIDILENNPAVTETLYKDWQSKQFCSCVVYAKFLTGYNQSVGWARNWPINSLVPVVGGVVVTKEGGGHVAVITNIHEETITIKEANYISCQKGERQLNLKDLNILGFWSP